MHIYNAHRGQLGLHLPQKLIVDNFAGGGGASMGLEAGFGRPVDIAINHNAEAISMHQTNHPDTAHYCESVWNVDPVRACHGMPVEWAHFSPDCTHHSKARGGKPKKKEIRGLAWIVIKWAILKRPEMISLENVEEFRDWGPLDAAGQPIKERAGQTYLAFMAMLTTGIHPAHPAVTELREFMPDGFDITPAIKGLGYSVDWKELRACDFGAPTTRNRLFMLSRVDGGDIHWPAPTHGHGPGLIPYRTAAECIDWTIPCPSIFDRPKPLAAATLRRIAKGLRKFVIDAKQPFIVPAEMVAPFITDTANGSSQRNMPINEPLRTITAMTKGGTFALVAPIIERQFGTASGNPIDEPLRTIMPGGSGKSALVAAFLTKHYGGNYTGSGLSLNQPLGTITTIDHHALSVAFLLKYYGNEKDGCSLGDPLHTIPTKDRFGLVVVNIDGDPYRIVDIGMRMLQPHELYKAQGFPDGYIHDRLADGTPLTKTAQVRMVGNSVSPPVLEAIVRANTGATATRSKVA